MKTTTLTELPNIGEVLSENLKEAGINTADELRSIGCENAFIRLKTIDPEACTSKLFAIEGAIQGIRWHDLDLIRRDELKAFFKQFKKQQ